MLRLNQRNRCALATPLTTGPASQSRKSEPISAYSRLLKNPKASIRGRVMAKRASASSRPASQPATTVRASIQALMLRNCSITPCKKVTFIRAVSACANALLRASLVASHSK